MRNLMAQHRSDPIFVPAQRQYASKDKDLPARCHKCVLLWAINDRNFPSYILQTLALYKWQQPLHYPLDLLYPGVAIWEYPPCIFLPDLINRCFAHGSFYARCDDVEASSSGNRYDFEVVHVDTSCAGSNEADIAVKGWSRCPAEEKP